MVKLETRVRTIGTKLKQLFAHEEELNTVYLEKSRSWSGQVDAFARSFFAKLYSLDPQLFPTLDQKLFQETGLTGQSEELELFLHPRFRGDFPPQGNNSYPFYCVAQYTAQERPDTKDTTPKKHSDTKHTAPPKRQRWALSLMIQPISSSAEEAVFTPLRWQADSLDFIFVPEDNDLNNLASEMMAADWSLSELTLKKGHYDGQSEVLYLRHRKRKGLRNEIVTDTYDKYRNLDLVGKRKFAAYQKTLLL